MQMATTAAAVPTVGQKRHLTDGIIS